MMHVEGFGHILYTMVNTVFDTEQSSCSAGANRRPSLGFPIWDCSLHPLAILYWPYWIGLDCSLHQKDHHHVLTTYI